MARPRRRPGIHFEYNVDLTDPDPERLRAIKSDLVKKITENVGRELRELRGRRGDVGDLVSAHDRHYSIHSRD